MHVLSVPRSYISLQTTRKFGNANGVFKTFIAPLVDVSEVNASVVIDGRGELHIGRLAAAAHRRKPHQGVPELPRTFRQRQEIVQVVLVVLAAAKVSKVWRIMAATHGASQTSLVAMLGSSSRRSLSCVSRLPHSGV